MKTPGKFQTLLVLVILVVVLLACKESKEHREARREASRVKPGESPSEILARAAEEGDKFGNGDNGRSVRVTGVASECSGGTEIYCCSLLTGGKKPLRACMKTFMNPFGIGHEDPPKVGEIETMQCEEILFTPETPFLRQCEVLHWEPQAVERK